MSTESDANRLTTEIRDSVAIIRFTRPAERNPLSTATLGQLRIAFSSLTNHANVQAIIITGAEDVFASGADIRELTTLDSQSALPFAKLGQDLFQAIADASKLIIAAINGYCMGGALDLALACHIRVASASAVFSHPGARLGIITGWGGTQRLPRVIGRARALEFLMTARRVESKEALEMGLVSKVCDPVLDCALQVVEDSRKKRAPNQSSTP